MFALLAPEKPHPGRAGRPLDGRWLAARATADILDRDFGLALAGDAGRGPAGPGHSLRARPASKPGWLPSRPAARCRQKVVVSIPCFQAWGSLARAVESVLDQTHGDLLVIAANDGDDHPRWDVLGHIRDPRLVRVDYQANRGRYFADQIALMARLGQYLLDPRRRRVERARPRAGAAGGDAPRARYRRRLAALSAPGRWIRPARRRRPGPGPGPGHAALLRTAPAGRPGRPIRPCSTRRACSTWAAAMAATGWNTTTSCCT